MERLIETGELLQYCSLELEDRALNLTSLGSKPQPLLVPAKKDLKHKQLELVSSEIRWGSASGRGYGAQTSKRLLY